MLIGKFKNIVRVGIVSQTLLIGKLKQTVLMGCVGCATVVSNWILALGTWNDSGVWIDTELWKDS